MVRTLLVYPSPTRHAAPPLGIAYLGAILKEQGKEVKLIDVNTLENEEEYKKIVHDYNPEIIGFSAQTMFMDHAYHYGQLTKEILPNSKIVFGGPHPSVFPEETVKKTYIDMCMVGESEISFPQLVDAIEKGNNLKNVGNLYYKENGHIKKTERLPCIEDLDSIPFPSRDLLPMDLYLRNIPAPPWTVPYTHVMVNRGCPFDCTFCQPTSHVMWGRKTRYRSPKNICDEIELLTEKYKINSIDINGDTFTVNKKWVLDFCKEIKGRKFDVQWGTTTRVNTVDYETLKALKDAGCFVISEGVESGNQDILNSMNKGITVEQIRQFFKWCNRLGIITSCSYMIGNPDETLKSLQDTLNIIKETRPDYFVAYYTTPLPGTILFEYAKKEGLLNFQSYEELDKHHLGTMKIKNITFEQLKEYRDKIYNEYARMRLQYLFDPKKAYLTKQMFKRVFSLRHARLRAFKKSYQMLHSEETKPIKRIKEMVIKAM